MPRSPHPYIDWRQGRPRFKPSPELRALGHRSFDLKHPDGRWLSKGESVDWSASFKAGLPKPPPRDKTAPRGSQGPRLTLGRMVEAWQRQSNRWLPGPRQLRPATLRDYRQKLGVIERDFWDVWTSPARSVTHPIVQSLYDEIERTRGLATARASVTILGIAYKWAMTRGKLTLAQNPCHGLDKQIAKPRIRFATRREIAALIAAADAQGLPEIGDAVVMGLWTGQRQGDRLSLLYHGKLKNRRVFRQSKRGAIVHVLEAPELERRLAASLERRKAKGLVDPHVILNERTWRPFVADTYRHDFGQVRAAAALACPSLASLRDQDLRDTAVTWMALAQATIPEIAAVTGHSAEGAHQILKHYLASHPELADSAIRKMIAWFDAGGETEIG